MSLTVQENVSVFYCANRTVHEYVLVIDQILFYDNIVLTPLITPSFNCFWFSCTNLSFPSSENHAREEPRRDCKKSVFIFLILYGINVLLKSTNISPFQDVDCEVVGLLKI